MCAFPTGFLNFSLNYFSFHLKTLFCFSSVYSIIPPPTVLYSSCPACLHIAIHIYIVKLSMKPSTLSDDCVNHFLVFILLCSNAFEH